MRQYQELFLYAINPDAYRYRMKLLFNSNRKFSDISDLTAVKNLLVDYLTRSGETDTEIVRSKLQEELDIDRLRDTFSSKNCRPRVDRSHYKRKRLEEPPSRKSHDSYNYHHKRIRRDRRERKSYKPYDNKKTHLYVS